MDTIYDAVVIGAGPSGSSAAYRLADAGAHVLVLEKAEMPRDKLCGGAVSEEALEYLDFSIPDNLVDAECYGATVHYGDYSVACTLQDRVAIYVKRRDFDAYLLDQARDRGADVVYKFVKSIDVRDDRITLHTTDNQYDARVVVDATGAASKLVQQVRPKDPPDARGVCLEQNYPVMDPDPFAHLLGSMDIYFGISGFGYGWIFHHGDHYNIGVGGLTSLFENPQQAMRDFWVEHGLPIEDFKPRGWSIPCGGIDRTLISERVLLAGDAGGFVDPFCGEGIAYAIRSGQIAARTVLSALEAGDFSEAGLAAYIDDCEAAFNTNLKYSLRLSRLMYRFPAVFLRMLCNNQSILKNYLKVPMRRMSYRRFLIWLLLNTPVLAIGSYTSRRAA